jgi:hypothetical protein
LVSAYWKEKQNSKTSHVVGELQEDAWTYRDAIALTDNCKTEGGWFGAPLIDRASKKIVGILNSSNTTGGLCTLDNPCEILPESTRMAFHRRSYAQRTSPIMACVTSAGNIDLNQLGCKLQKPLTAETPAVIPVRKPRPTPVPPGIKSTPKAKKSSWPSMN